MANLILDKNNGDLTLHTGVAGSAAKMGHRLVIGIEDWHAEALIADGQVLQVTLAAELASLRVRSGEGGLKPVSPGDLETIAGNAQRSLEVAKYPVVRFRCDAAFDVPDRAGEVHLRGTLEIHGQQQPIDATVTINDGGAAWNLTTAVPIRQTDFGVKPYSTMLGQLRVADEVMVEFSASVPK
jgi:polyisoprenoid-binding protein YceI